MFVVGGMKRPRNNEHNAKKPSHDGKFHHCSDLNFGSIGGAVIFLLFSLFHLSVCCQEIPKICRHYHYIHIRTFLWQTVGTRVIAGNVHYKKRLTEKEKKIEERLIKGRDKELTEHKQK